MQIKLLLLLLLKHSIRHENGRHLAKLGRRRFAGSPRSPRTPRCTCLANPVPRSRPAWQTIELGGLQALGPKAAGSWAEDTRHVTVIDVICSNWSSEIFRVPPKFLGPMPCKCRPGKYAGLQRIELCGL